jgi:hypothetical protein
MLERKPLSATNNPEGIASFLHNQADWLEKAYFVVDTTATMNSLLANWPKTPCSS